MNNHHEVLNLNAKWHWGTFELILIYIVIGIICTTSMTMDFISLKKKKKKRIVIFDEEKLSSLLVFLGFLCLLFYQYLKRWISGMIIILIIVVIAGYIFLSKLF